MLTTNKPEPASTTKASILVASLVAGMLALSLFWAIPGTAYAGDTEDNLYAAIQSETNAAATYHAYAAKADEEGYHAIALLFRATADAEAKHADALWDIYAALDGAKAKPTAGIPIVGTTIKNLEAAIERETYEYTVMYPEFQTVAQAEGKALTEEIEWGCDMPVAPENLKTDAAHIFNVAMQAEQIHAGNLKDVLDNFTNMAYVNDTYGMVYCCVVCGQVVAALPVTSCSICNASKDSFVVYSLKSENESPSSTAPTGDVYHCVVCGEVVTAQSATSCPKCSSSGGNSEKSPMKSETEVPPLTAPTDNAIWLYGFGIVSGCLLIGLASYLIVRKRRKSRGLVA